VELRKLFPSNSMLFEMTACRMPFSLDIRLYVEVLA